MKNKQRRKSSFTNNCICNVFNEALPGDVFFLVFKGLHFQTPQQTFVDYNSKTNCVTVQFDFNGTTQVALVDCDKIAGVIPGNI
ncbi:hypothetical protein [Fictibacillus fluitans]|uniref:DUF3992 domain-containing protein n=1 Tax=Fictibacillus fluitans TaxID=3058422 RepID=A0ABT8I003_9BACL|nr:hypothetical protein [Fictibacillus sp. NE201]MDN4526347.1 hypothetical protein [Fictibacillus sp. NE201]